MEKVRVDSAPRVVSDRLRRDIQLGTYHPGDKLPPQHELAHALGVSRVTLREALRILEGEGYIDVRRGSRGGSVILASAEPVEVMRLKLIARLDEFDQWLEFRSPVEAAAAALAAVRASSKELDALAKTIDDIRAAKSVYAFRGADSAFHNGVALAARNEPIRHAVEDSRAAMYMALDTFPFEPMVNNTLDGHGAILAALRNRDAEAARAAMAAHIDGLREEVRIILGVQTPNAISAQT